MQTIVYLIRHSEKMTGIIADYSVNETPEKRNEKQVLSINGERKAEQLSKREELQNINAIYSSHYVRCIATGKYIASNLGLKINVDERLGERRIGNLELTKEKLSLYDYNQHHDFEYKVNEGESINDTKNRTTQVFNEIIDMHLGQEVVLITHLTSALALLSNFCDIGYNLDNEIVLTFNENTTFTKIWNQPELIKIILEDKEVIDIQRIELDYEG